MTPTEELRATGFTSPMLMARAPVNRGELLVARLILCDRELITASLAPLGRTKAEAQDIVDRYEAAERNQQAAYQAVVNAINGSTP